MAIGDHSEIDQSVGVRPPPPLRHGRAGLMAIIQVAQLVVENWRPMVTTQWRPWGVEGVCQIGLAEEDHHVVHHQYQRPALWHQSDAWPGPGSPTSCHHQSLIWTIDHSCSPNTSTRNMFRLGPRHCSIAVKVMLSRSSLSYVISVVDADDSCSRCSCSEGCQARQHSTSVSLLIVASPATDGTPLYMAMSLWSEESPRSGTGFQDIITLS